MHARIPAHFGFGPALLISVAFHGVLLAVAANVRPAPSSGQGGLGSGSGSEYPGFEILLAPGPRADGALVADLSADPRPRLAEGPPPDTDDAADLAESVTPAEPLAWLGALPEPEASPTPVTTVEEPARAGDPAAAGEDIALAEWSLAGSEPLDRGSRGSRAGSAENGSRAAASNPVESGSNGGPAPGASSPAGALSVGLAANGGGAGPSGPPGEPGSGPTRMPPVLVRSGTLPYPPSALRLGHEGKVLLRIHVSSGGKVQDVDLVESSGHAELDRAALAAVRSWKFRPATERGVAVHGSLLHRIVFRIEDVS